MAKFRKKPLVIEAIRWTGSNRPELEDFVGNHIRFYGVRALIRTLEGTMEASVGDYIIKGVKGEFYPCKYAIFEETYEAVEDGVRATSLDDFL